MILKSGVANNMKTYIVYRNFDKQITKYSVYTKTKDDLQKLIFEFNNQNGPTKAEITTDDDLISLIKIAEENKLIKQSDLRSIEDALDNVQSEFWLLKESVTQNERK